MNWTELDWPALDRLRQRFLGDPGGGPYWQTESELAAYDATYAERIGWKWDQVLRELKWRGWRPPSSKLLDWGCGTGIAARRAIAAFGAPAFTSASFWDHSPLAAGFAVERTRGEFPSIDAAQATPGFLAGFESVGLLLVSHVLNELDAPGLDSLLAMIRRADALVWVEPGTHDISRRLGGHRDALLDAFDVIAPCTHALGCPMFASGNERHWCHFFAPPPAEIFANPDWVKFGQRAGIDLRSLPYSFVALQRKTAGGALPSGATGLSRVIGRPEHFKPYARLLNCDATGLAELTVPKRAAPALVKELDRTRAPLVYRWVREGDSISAGSLIGKEPAPG